MEQIGQTIKTSSESRGGYGSSFIKGFTMAPNLVLKNSSYNHNEKMVAITLKSFAMGKRECWPSIKKIAIRASLGLTATKETLNSLASKGLIERNREGKHKSVCYLLKY